jgi:hypothetical protein
MGHKRLLPSFETPRKRAALRMTEMSAVIPGVHSAKAE